jgi:hypothetical protein
LPVRIDKVSCMVGSVGTFQSGSSAESVGKNGV